VETVAHPLPATPGSTPQNGRGALFFFDDRTPLRLYWVIQAFDFYAQYQEVSGRQAAEEADAASG
jgi:hypothetical protein